MKRTGNSTSNRINSNMDEGEFFRQAIQRNLELSQKNASSASSTSSASASRSRVKMVRPPEETISERNTGTRANSRSYTSTERTTQTNSRSRQVQHADSVSSAALHNSKKPAASEKKHKLSSKTKRKIVLDIILAVILIIVICVVIMISGLKTVRYSDEEFGVLEENKVQTTQDITNIVFLGIDRQENRSDVMMVLSVNKTTNTLHVISLLRDSKVTIEGCDYQTKLGYAYKWGGSAFAVKTINENFHTAFNQYVTMNFENVADIVDMLGGVDIELSQAEADEVNFLADDVGYFEDDAVAGLNHLNGQQAVSFSRIREIDGEYYRASRQQVVMEAMFAKIKTISKLQYPILIKNILSTIETTLSFFDVLSLASMDLSTLKIERHTIPDERYELDLWSGWETVENWEPKETCNIDEVQWVWIYDLDSAADRLRRIIYEDAD